MLLLVALTPVRLREDVRPHGRSVRAETLDRHSHGGLRDRAAALAGGWCAQPPRWPPDALGSSESPPFLLQLPRPCLARAPHPGVTQSRLHAISRSSCRGNHGFSTNPFGSAKLEATAGLATRWRPRSVAINREADRNGKTASDRLSTRCQRTGCSHCYRRVTTRQGYRCFRASTAG